MSIDRSTAPLASSSPSDSLATRLRIGFVSLGCPKNLVDSEVMMGMLSTNGAEITSHAEDADIIVVNTCSFIDTAKQESVDTILEMVAAQDPRPRPQAHRHRLPGGALPRRDSEEHPGDRRRARHRRAGRHPGRRRNRPHRAGSHAIHDTQRRYEHPTFARSRQIWATLRPPQRLATTQRRTARARPFAA